MCQVGDYGCYLKMDSGADVLRAQALLLKVFMMIGGRSCTEYIRALTASIMLWDAASLLAIYPPQCQCLQ